MTTLDEMLKNGSKEQIWEKYCGHLDLSLKEFMQIQERLLLEQLELLEGSEIGNKLFGNRAPKTVDEFRSLVPLTNYDFYAPFLLEQKADGLPKDDYIWCHTSGKGGQYKWVPYTKRMYTKLGEVVVGAMILASCKYKGDITIEPGDVVMLTTAPRPYMSGYVSLATQDEVSVHFVPSIAEAEKMSFGERISKGFEMAQTEGLDYFFGIASILAKIGERFEQGGSKVKFSFGMLNPKFLVRMGGGFLKAKMKRRALLPQDIWNIKGVMTGGMDTDIYRDRIVHYWGKNPLEGYACTEGGMFGTQAWNFKGLTLFPDCDFYEFIPMDEYEKNKKNPNYQPKTVLMDELKPGIYELVFTNLLGGVITRYRVGDLLQVVSLKDEEAGINIPQFRFYSRADDLIDLGSMARFTEKAIWEAIDKSGIAYVDWVARKEMAKGEPVLHLYIEFKDGTNIAQDIVAAKIRSSLQKECPDFKDMENMFGNERLLITQLPANTFNVFTENQQKAGADLAHLKPPRMQPKEDVLHRLLGGK